MIDRYLERQLIKTLDDGLIAILYGARQVGKTTLATKILSTAGNGLYLDCDDPTVVIRLRNQSLASLKALIGNADLIVIDEAQRVENIGLTAKLIHDNLPEKKLLLTGSSSLDLANQIKEPLTGRSRELLLYPLALTELTNSIIEADGYMQRLLVYGGYPGLWDIKEEEAARQARELANRYLYRDAFALNTIYDQTVIDNLLRLLAHQVGSEVSYSELASSLEISKDTVMRYVDLLEKAFIVFRLPQFRKNQRVQIGRLRKIYFYDLGIRNALIDDFKAVKLRGDVSALWENFIIAERLKKHQRDEQYVRSYYWRSRDRQEIDLIEEAATQYQAFECKWKKASRVPAGFKNQYPDIPFVVITIDNYWDFVHS
ncbi:MAG: ATP-binding protein [Actinobacteria bacterium]|nr:ATP-binding protein [Actinomycetota bacterium]MCL6105372.1 ATP-binding protein [Actinomycetota bacterium]